MACFYRQRDQWKTTLTKSFCGHVKENRRRKISETGVYFACDIDIILMVTGLRKIIKSHYHSFAVWSDDLQFKSNFKDVSTYCVVTTALRLLTLYQSCVSACLGTSSSSWWFMCFRLSISFSLGLLALWHSWDSPSTSAFRHEDINKIGRWLGTKIANGVDEMNYTFFPQWCILL